LYGDIYNTDKLDEKLRETAIVSSLITLGYANNPLYIHMHGALNIGITRQQLIEIIIQITAYAGFPAAVNAMHIAKQVFRERPERKQKLKKAKKAILPFCVIISRLIPPWSERLRLDRATVALCL
jgi:hypothetical protein